MPQNSQEQSEAQLLLGTIVKSPDDFLASLLGMLDFDDFYNTSFRLWEVFSNLIANPANRIQGNEVDPKDYPDSNFAHFFQDSAAAISEYFTGCVLFSSLSLIRQLYRSYRQRQSDSYRYMQTSLVSIGVKENDKLLSSIDEIQASLVKLLLEINPYYELDTSNKKNYIKIKHKTAVLRAPPKPKNLEKFAEKSNKIDSFFNWINKLRKTNLGAFCRELWVNLRANTFMFWAVWMPFNIAVGTAAVATTSVFAPVILSISLGIMAIYSIWKAYKHVQEAIKIKNKSQVDLQKETKAAKEKDACKKEKRHVINNLKQRFFIEKFHHQQRQRINITYTEIINQLDINNELLCQKITETSPNHESSPTAFTSTVNSNSGLCIPQQIKPASHSNNENVKDKQASQPLSKITFTDNYKPPVKILLGQWLVGNTSERWSRLIIHTLLQGIAGFTGSAFILWFVSYLLGTLASTSAFAFLGATATFLGGPVALIGIGAILGLIFAIKGAAKIWQEQKEFQKMVETKLGQEHVIYNHNKEKYEFTGKTKLQIFEENEEKITNAKKRIGILENNIKPKVKLFNRLLEAGNSGKQLQKLAKNNILINNDELKTINIKKIPTGEQSFQKFIWVKKFLNRAYELLAGQQTGIYLTRILFLSAGVAGSVVAGLVNPAIAFLIIAGVLSLVVGLPRLARYQLDRNQEHRTKFIDTLDVHINYLENSANNLTLLEEKLTGLDKKLDTTIPLNANDTNNAQIGRTLSSSSGVILNLISNQKDEVENIQTNENKQPQQKSKNTSFGDLIRHILTMFFKKIGIENVNQNQTCAQAAVNDSAEQQLLTLKV